LRVETRKRGRTVVDLSEEGLLLTLGREVLHEAKRVPQLERYRVRVAPLELGVVARPAAAHVVLLAVGLKEERRLAVHLEEADDKEDLQLGGCRQRVPHVGRRARAAEMSAKEMVGRSVVRSPGKRASGAWMFHGK
jgi:hypothetical protein